MGYGGLGGGGIGTPIHYMTGRRIPTTLLSKWKGEGG